MKKRIFNFGKKLYHKFPVLRPYMRFVHKHFIIKPKFSDWGKPIILFEGWGMTTEHQVPWIDDLEFYKTNQIVKQTFIHDGVVNIADINIDILLWRHWNVAFCIRYATKFAKQSNFNFVECGVASGMSAYFAFVELGDRPYTFHLYDSWGIMKSEYLYDTEKEHIGKYDGQSIQNTKKI